MFSSLGRPARLRCTSATGSQKYSHMLNCTRVSNAVTHSGQRCVICQNGHISAFISSQKHINQNTQQVHHTDTNPYSYSLSPNARNKYPSAQNRRCDFIICVYKWDLSIAHVYRVEFHTDRVRLLRASALSNDKNEKTGKNTYDSATPCEVNALRAHFKPLSQQDRNTVLQHSVHL